MCPLHSDRHGEPLSRGGGQNVQWSGQETNVADVTGGHRHDAKTRFSQVRRNKASEP